MASGWGLVAEKAVFKVLSTPLGSGGGGERDCQGTHHWPVFPSIHCAQVTPRPPGASGVGSSPPFLAL